MKQSLVDILESIEGNGAFSNLGVQSFILPGLHVEQFGEVGFPLAKSEAERLIAYAQKASFGKGTSTILDTDVRSVWEIDARQLSFHNQQWNEVIHEIIEKSRKGFGIENGKIEASLYKLLIYQEGDFFLPHRDSEKENGMFATLIIGLPSKHTGGELIVKHSSLEYTYDFSVNDYLYNFPFVSFYADCEHEVKPVTSGYRICLVYNLLLKETTKNYTLPDFTRQINSLVQGLQILQPAESNKPSIILLSHQYTPSNFSVDSLKHHDRPRAEAFLQAAALSGYSVSLGLVTYYKMGNLEDGNYDYNYRSYQSNDESDGQMGEVYEESLYIEHWSTTASPGFGRLAITKNNLLSNNNMDDEEPIEKFQEGYTGNAGMTIEYFYHYGALIFWKKESEIDIIKDCTTGIQIEWLEHYSRLTLDTAGVSSIDKIKLLLQAMISKPLNNYYDSKKCNALLEALILIRDIDILRGAFAPLLFPMFTKIDTDLWIDIIKAYAPSEFNDFFIKIRKEGTDAALAHHLDILYKLSLNNSNNINYNNFIQKELAELPASIATERENQNDKNIPIRIIYLTLCLSKAIDDKPWCDRVLEAIIHKKSRAYINNVLCQALTQYLNTKSTQEMLASQLKEFCINNLEERIANKPSPPSTWTRSIPSMSSEWQLLQSFMASPVERVFEYRKGQQYRDQLANMISNSSVDLTCETIKKGSPYTLKLTKNQNSYEKSLNEWVVDVELLKMMQ